MNKWLTSTLSYYDQLVVIADAGICDIDGRHIGDSYQTIKLRY